MTQTNIFKQINLMDEIQIKITIPRFVRNYKSLLMPLIGFYINQNNGRAMFKKMNKKKGRGERFRPLDPSVVLSILKILKFQKNI